MKITFECTDTDELPEAAEILTSYFSDRRVFTFYGDLGAGKTTFIKAICRELGVSGSVNSPSYGLVNEYPLKNGKKVYHFDFYRIESPAEAIDMGFTEYLSEGNYCLIEWPEKVEELLPDDRVKVTITSRDGIRSIRMEP